MNLKALRAAALAKAQGIIKSAEGRDFTTSEISDLNGLKAEIAELDAKIKAHDEGAALRDAIGGYGPDERHGEAKAGTGHLEFRGLAGRMTESMKAYSQRVAPGVKALVPGGEAVVALPIVNTEPLASTAAHETVPRLIDLLGVTVRTAPAYRVLRQVAVGTPGNAGVVAPGDLKPTRVLSIKPTDSRLRVVAVLSEAIDKFLLEDASNLSSWVGLELADAIREELERQVLTGNGVGENFQGLATASGVQTQAFATDRFVTLASSLAKLQNLGIEPDFIALSAADALAVTTTRNANGQFELGGAIDAAARTIFGTRWVVVPGLAAGDAFVVGKDSIGLSTDSGGVRVEWGSPADQWQRNQVQARVEGRFQLDVMRAHGVVKTRLAV